MRTANILDQTIKYMRDRGYEISTHPKEYNIVYLEGVNTDGTLNDDAPDKFNDLRMVIEFIDDVPKIVGRWVATTEPGSYYTRHPMNTKGAARIAFGQYKSWRVGIHGGSEPHEALVQVAPVKVCRDANKDMVRTGDLEDTGLFGINQHCGYDSEINNIGRTSAGCLVGRTRDGHKKFMEIIKRDERYRADNNYLFWSAIIPGDEL